MRSFPFVGFGVMIVMVTVAIMFLTPWLVMRIEISCPQVGSSCVGYIEVPAMFDGSYTGTGTKLTARKSNDGSTTKLDVTLDYRYALLTEGDRYRSQKYFRKTGPTDSVSIANVGMVCARSRDGQRVYVCTDVN